MMRDRKKAIFGLGVTAFGILLVIGFTTQFHTESIKEAGAISIATGVYFLGISSIISATESPSKDIDNISEKIDEEIAHQGAVANDIDIRLKNIERIVEQWDMER